MPDSIIGCLLHLVLFYVKAKSVFMDNTSRREFLKKAILESTAMFSVGFLLLKGNENFISGLFSSPSATSFPNSYKNNPSGKEAMFYQKLANNVVRCQLCPHRCSIADGKSGFCRVRKNNSGKLYSMVYGRPCTVDIGPIEKAPLYHFIPGHRRLCLATVGCNLRCKYCHNWQISQSSPGQLREHDMSADDIVNEAIRRGVKSVSFTYTEPTIFYEYLYDISRIAKRRGLKTSIVSNGFINSEPLRKLIPYLDAVKIDLKAFNEDFYRDISSARLEPVMQTLRILKEENAFFEIVNLIVPTLNDDSDEIRKMCIWISDTLGKDVPIHFSRFSPSYKLTNLSSTPVSTLEQAVSIAFESGLKYAYIGNVPGHKYNSTYCPKCRERLIHRTHFSVLSYNLEEGDCSFCGYSIHGIWKKM